WTGNGQTGIGIVDPTTETWYLRNSLSPGAPNFVPFAFGAPGWLPVTGDWTGSGQTGIGVVDPTTDPWYLRKSLSPAAPNFAPFVFGPSGATPVVGQTQAAPDPNAVPEPSSLVLAGIGGFFFLAYYCLRRHTWRLWIDPNRRDVRRRQRFALALAQRI